jgi:hypothetical protein
MTVQIGQVYRDNDPRLAGRTLRVVDIEALPQKAVLETVTNPDDVQRLLDDETPGTRSYKPVDKRGRRTKIAVERLESSKFSLVEQGPEISGPVA